MFKTWAIVFAGLFFLAGAALAGDISLGIKAGIADPGGLALGGLVRGKLAPNWRIEGSVEYFGEDFWRDVSINGTGAYEFPVSGTVQPYLGFGAGAHIYSWEGGYHHWLGDDRYFDSHSNTYLGLHLLGGADFEISKQTKIITEIKYIIITDHDGADALTITGGVAFKLK